MVNPESMVFLSFRFLLSSQKGSFEVSSHLPSGWTHVVLNYIGPGDGQGIWMLYNGTEVANDDTYSCCTQQQAADGRILVGKHLLDGDTFLL